MWCPLRFGSSLQGVCWHCHSVGLRCGLLDVCNRKTQQMVPRWVRGVSTRAQPLTRVSPKSIIRTFELVERIWEQSCNMQEGKASGAFWRWFSTSFSHGGYHSPLLWSVPSAAAKHPVPLTESWGHQDHDAGGEKPFCLGAEHPSGVLSNPQPQYWAPWGPQGWASPLGAEHPSSGLSTLSPWWASSMGAEHSLGCRTSPWVLSTIPQGSAASSLDGAKHLGCWASSLGAEHPRWCWALQPFYATPHLLAATSMARGGPWCPCPHEHPRSCGSRTAQHVPVLVYSSCPAASLHPSASWAGVWK